MAYVIVCETVVALTCALDGVVVLTYALDGVAVIVDSTKDVRICVTASVTVLVAGDGVAVVELPPSTATTE